MEACADMSQSYSEQRTVPRYMFAATVDVVEPATEMHFSGRVSEISRKGCYVDILNTLPKETPVQLRVLRDKGTFVTDGKVIYVQEGVGMGVGFIDVPPNQLEILDSWLDELKG
jgi:PilZ domain